MNLRIVSLLFRLQFLFLHHSSFFVLLDQVQNTLLRWVILALRLLSIIIPFIEASFDQGPLIFAMGYY